MDAFLAGLAAAFTPQIMLLVTAGTLLGIIVGALPGISGSTTTALLLPLTITMSPNAAIAFLGAIYCAANYGGSITAILINSPGDPSASATAFDGYALARKGEAGRALGMSAVASAIGGIFSVVVLIVAAPLLARLAYQFGPPEYFALALFGLSMVAAVGGDSPAKNLLAGAAGVLLATIGLDLTTGVERFTFGVPALSDGLDFIPVLVGLFAIAELFERMAQRGAPLQVMKLNAMKLPTWADFKKCGKAISLSSVIGTFIGILPALGATTAALICYNETKRWSKYKEEFGKGAIEGVAGPEAANNAAVGGAMVPTLALGIPGSTTTAIILAGLMIQGVRPGPHLFNEQPTLLYVVFGSMLFCNLLYLVLGFVFAKAFARITLIPDSFLWPAVFILSVVGAYAPNQSIVDVWVMLAFGVVGYFFRRYGFSPAPLIMGLVLGKMVEETLKQSLLIFDQDWTQFFHRPMVVVLFAITVAGLAVPPLWRAWKHSQRPPAERPA
ncbi:MAG TPA: tripartite tricarboxylate transporter permease [Usitatibacter sp.]|nr:tripartite tricarboxylate transporter permease [Usitatibacter sp.]